MTTTSEFYKTKSWGSRPIQLGKDLPTLKIKRLFDVLNALPKEAKVLEIGSGSGRILATIQRQYPQMKLTGVDLSKSQVALANKTNPRIKFVQGNAENLPFPKNSFQAVVLLDLLEHVQYPEKVLSEVRRVLRANGTFHCFVPAENHGIYALSTTMFGRHFKEATAGHIQQFKKKQLLQMIRKEFKVLEVTYSYHLLGSIMDYTLFTLLLNKRIAKIFWNGNQYYENANTKKTIGSRILNGLMRIGNNLAYWESTTLKASSLLATGIHVTAVKNGRNRNHRERTGGSGLRGSTSQKREKSGHARRRPST